MTVSPDLLGLASQITQKYSNAQIAQLVRLISPVSPNALMGPEEFERVMAILISQSRRRPFSARSLSAARLVLVMGASVSEAAVETGLARQVVHTLMQRIRSRLEGLPGDWVKVEEWLPPAAAGDVVELAESLRSAHAQGTMSELSS
ncbi:hypothetical protein ALP05_200110 [Pseudomonas caricapapayae]|uniref:TrfB transcriptional repressor protein domain-containing protein n=1 Tax=Pseudomonas caricapapayae TaxID=46678 RepID=A0A3M6EXB0_9PSED|nr:TrfB-related DNA-binding protein [Pseudomonas caricapapayae]RMV72898.1 hypothetical protein ALP05_200110 [Pseudomonas caricapapayae]